MMKCFAILPVITTIVAGLNLQFDKRNTDTKARIIGGSNAPEGLYPYQISLRNRGKHICGGSIIEHEWIVTAAHCVAGMPISNLTIVAGTNKLSTGGIIYNITKVYIHEDFYFWIFKNDVAMLKVKYINYTDNIKPIIMDSLHIGSGEPCTLSGWGMKLYPSPAPNNLQHINLTTTTVDLCKFLLQPINDDQLCTFSKVEEGACRFDSGGPLVRKINGSIKQIGVVSWGILCALGYPDVHSRVSSYFDWFKKTCNNCI